MSEDVDVAIVLVVSFQPLECTLDYHPPDSEVTVRIVGAFLPHNHNIQLGV